ncbi:MAG: hypothetical protein JSV21_10725 [Nitrospirota bacterium]|nr:MAG: hypothetical protein JSV21_10725 [Nitrospirota bacterium]
MRTVLDKVNSETHPKPDNKAMPVFIDAGVENIRLHIHEVATTPSSGQVDSFFKEHGVTDRTRTGKDEILITGKLAEIVQEKTGGKILLPGAVLWARAKKLAREHQCSVGIIELSASGYAVICVDKEGDLLNDRLVVNPKCGAGCGINLKRILEKLDVRLEDADIILKDYLGLQGKNKRGEVTVRADRCGVFSSSATISDKNQGIPLDHALATTMKSEVMKACTRMLKVEKVFLTGGVFKWEYMRDCACDYLKGKGMSDIEYIHNIMLDGMKDLWRSVDGNLNEQGKRISRVRKLHELPSFSNLKNRYQGSGIYLRLPEEEIPDIGKDIETIPVNMALDVGSTMAKIVIADTDNNILFSGSYSNHGDTVQTIKHIFRELTGNGIEELNIQHIGITGSGRYQVQKVLKNIYPKLDERVFVLVENYAHAHGSIQYAKDHLAQLGDNVNKDFYVLVDIGGEDTKVSIISLKKEELFDNVMNIKCSAGTGSLMDTLMALFDISDINTACSSAYNSPRAYEINATCAVFLMENAKKMQAGGYSNDEILASCNYAIVENMARTLWDQIEFPENSVVLLHGQTMLSDPLPLAVTHRIQEFSKMHCLVPPMPGHRACIGLLRSIKDDGIIDNPCRLKDFIDVEFEKKIFYCRGAACGDKSSCCARTMLKTTVGDSKISLSLGGCTAVNEMTDRKREKIPNSYREIWSLFDSRLPRSSSKDRLVIPRSFSVSEQSFLFASIFKELGLPVHVDNVTEEDVLTGQPQFDIDICAPLIGSTGQFQRLANEDHGIILVAQIDLLPTNMKSLGKTCTVNQGGPLIATHYAKIKHPEARFMDFSVNMETMDPVLIGSQLHMQLGKLFTHYNITPSREELVNAVRKAIKANLELRKEIGEMAAEFIEYAIENRLNVSIVCAREYILNPGIYDSHVGRLLKDKGVIALPSYAFDIELDDDFSHIYWRNPHAIISLVSGVAGKKLHRALNNERLRDAVLKLENGGSGSLMSTVQVSTFRCGPDTVTMPTINEITKSIPTLFIQSDAMIKELAHLENRVNTHLNQLTKRLNEGMERHDFDIKVINDLGLEDLDIEKDVLYLPTLHDNRTVAAGMRASGITVIDNYDDKTYDIEALIRLGRKYCGDAVCAPMAGVFADIILALEDFERRKEAGDPLVNGKKRVVVFDNKGSGPCRQGQYYEQHKLICHKMYGNNGKGQQLKLLISRESKGFNIGLDEWALIQCYHGFILQGLLHQILMKGANCRDSEEYSKFYDDYLRMKQDVITALESSRPHPTKLRIAKLSSKLGLGALAKYWAYGLYNNNGIRKILSDFSSRWNRNGKKKISIFVEGEAYMRVAQIEDVFNNIVDSIGFGSFEMNYSPLWLYLELISEFAILDTEEAIDRMRWKDPYDPGIKKGIRTIRTMKRLIKYFRKIMVKPLYKAAGIKVPDPVTEVLNNARKLIPSIKPRGELSAYVGEAIHKVDHDVDLFLNIAPEGCLVSCMGEAMGLPIKDLTKTNSQIQGLFSLNGEVNEDSLRLALLKTLGPEKYYSSV